VRDVDDPVAAKLEEADLGTARAASDSESGAVAMPEGRHGVERRRGKPRFVSKLGEGLPCTGCGLGLSEARTAGAGRAMRAFCGDQHAPTLTYSHPSLRRVAGDLRARVAENGA
jgi:hypothetical protein